MNRDDFEILRDSKIVYFDNGATTLKPDVVRNSIDEYYNKYTSNIHRGDYSNSLKVSGLYDESRLLIKDFIGALYESEIVFTSGTTESINDIVFGYFKYHLNKGDEVLITKTEHASNVLPWLKLEKEIGIKVKYIPLDKDLKLSVENLENAITDRTKLVSIAHVTNTIGDVRDIKRIGKLLDSKNIYFVVDAAQSAGHRKIDVVESNIDFLAFSGHKMLGPTGIGVLYGKLEILKELSPVRVGGGMNSVFESSGYVEYKNPPARFEAGTPNIEGVIGLNAAIKYINEVGLDKIEEHDIELKNYLLSELEKIDNINIINKNAESGNILFNIEGVFAQDTAIYLDHYNICVRAGNHCAKLLKDELGIKNTCRISFYLYNTKDEIDKLIEVLKEAKNIFEVVI